MFLLKSVFSTHRHNDQSPFSPARMLPECILYVLTTDTHSRKAMGMSIAPRDYICDVATLKTRPSWLTGVPTLLVLATKNVYEGTQCLAYLAASLAASPITSPRVTEQPISDGVLFLDTPPSSSLSSPSPPLSPSSPVETPEPVKFEESILELLAPRQRHQEEGEGGGDTHDLILAGIRELHAFEPPSPITGGVMLFQIGAHIHT